ncbi:MAG: flavodoxin family protein [Candidatus Omnitrophica bacterium]|nr:flavodoxin family protein [Candidatus Omnitrophota bacterium]
MKILIVCYSFSGNTKRACLFLKENLKPSNSVDFIDLRPKKETSSFLGQCKEAFFKNSPDLLDCNYDLGSYEFIVFASPVWAFTVAPALRAYLNQIKNIENKKFGCLLTYGSGAGAGKALNYLVESLKHKNGKHVFSKNICGHKTKMRAYLADELMPLVKAINA